MDNFWVVSIGIVSSHFNLYLYTHRGLTFLLKEITICFPILILATNFTS